MKHRGYIIGWVVIRDSVNALADGLPRYLAAEGDHTIGRWQPARKLKTAEDARVTAEAHRQLMRGLLADYFIAPIYEHRGRRHIGEWVEVK